MRYIGIIYITLYEETDNYNYYIMKNLLKIFTLVALLCAASCNKNDEEPKTPNEPSQPEEPATPEVVIRDIAVEEVTHNSATITFSAQYADELAYIITPTAEFEAPNIADTFEKGTKLFQNKELWAELTPITFCHEGLDAEVDYTVVIAAANKIYSAVIEASFTTLADNNEEPKPEPLSVELSNLSVLDIQSTTAEFSVTVKNMNDLYYYLAPVAESSELTADEMLAQGDFVLYFDDNTSWEAEQVIPFNATALSPATEYMLQVMGFNDDSNALLTTTFTTTDAEPIIENVDFNATSASIRYDNPEDKRNGYLTFFSEGYELTVHLQSEELEGFYTPTSATHSYTAKGSLFKKHNDDGRVITYDHLDATFGSIDLYENLVTGNWEVYASLFFLDTISIELDYIGVIEGAERDEAKRYVLSLTEVTATPQGTQWGVRLWQDKNNTLELTVELGESLDHIPSGSYTTADGSLIAASSSMIVDNVRSTLAPSNIAVSSLTVEYDATTGESYLSTEIYTSSGTAVAVVERCGPYKLYEAKEVVAETITEHDPLIWVTRDSGDRWIVEWSGNNSTYGSLALVTGDASLDYIPAGRYYLRSTAPAEGGWIDCTDGNTRMLISRKSYTPLADNDACYLDITTRMNEGIDQNTIKGSVRTADGSYEVAIDFSGAFDYAAE